MAAPRDIPFLRSALREAAAHQHGPTALRFPNESTHPVTPAVGPFGTVDVLASSPHRDVLLVSFGTMAATWLEAAQKLTARGLGVTVVDPRWVKPVPPEVISLADGFRLIGTVEENTLVGGMGTAVTQALSKAGIRQAVCTFGLPEGFLKYGSRPDVLAFSGLTPHYIADRLMNILLATELEGKSPQHLDMSGRPAPSTPWGRLIASFNLQNAVPPLPGNARRAL
ncbi:transketolase C-terminal domain-containing protein [Kitasatospora sp. NPDC001603]|uniref:transketolase C-terminal domain-containing protein n=1 Tax=Kitasatospora sp. NPDC001603 TaxID=3154388 RepID=UPI00332F8040